MNPKRIDWDLTYHAPDAEKIAARGMLNDDVRELAHQLNDLLPDSREKSLAITALEEVRAWGNAAIAHNPRPEDST